MSALRIHPGGSAAMIALGLLFSGHAAAQGTLPYLVQLEDKPASSYAGDVAGLRATRPAAGGALDASSADVRRYADYLAGRHKSVLAAIGRAAPVHSYKLVFNGFSVRLTPAEAAALKATPGVLQVVREVPRKLDTHYTPAFLGLALPDGLWTKAGGSAGAGEGVVIGVIDTGIWPENPAFADRVDGSGAPSANPASTLAYGAPPAKWKGHCDVGPGMTAQNCNNKLIGARSFNAMLVADGKTLHWTEFDSARDSVNATGSRGGHGTHTASTAAGNHGAPAIIDGVQIGVASGMAPRARLAAYKVCWTYNDENAQQGSTNGCYPGDIIAAVEQSVADGVDVLNFSISGNPFIVDDPVDLAFLGAANAGVFVASSAGNSGPWWAPVAHGVPWMTSVAAATHDKTTGAVATLGNGEKLNGASLSATALPSTPVLLGADAGAIPYASLSELDQRARSQCFTAADRLASGASDAGALDRAYTAGRVVVCQRGENPRKEKAVAVKEAGGVGMVMIDDDNGYVYDKQVLPALHISRADGERLKAYLASASSPELALTAAGLHDSPEAAPKVVYFSSRGPNAAAPGLLKPEVAAPGVEILAGVTPVKTQAERNAIATSGKGEGSAWSFFSGTSMASPHIAGLGAVLKQLHPDWSPAAIKSALMTTAAATVDDGIIDPYSGKSPWGQGAGLVQPNLAADPGLVYDLAPADYQRFLCGADSASVPAALCAELGPVKDADLNQPGLVAPSLAEQQTLVRTVTNVGASAATYRASISLSGFDATVTPAVLALEPGESKSFSVQLKRDGAQHGVWQYGALEWSDGQHLVRSPIAARAMVLDVPQILIARQASGNKLFTITTGFASRLSVSKVGLSLPQRDTASIVAGNWDDYGEADCRAGGSASVYARAVTIPAGTLAARFATFDDETETYNGFTDDLNILILDSTGTLVGISNSSVASDEALGALNPEPGAYTVCVSASSTARERSTFALSSWLLKAGDTGGNLKALAPSVVGPNANGTVAVSWSGLQAGKRYFGLLQYKVNGTVEGTSTLFVETAAAKSNAATPSFGAKVQPPPAPPALLNKRRFGND